MTSPRRPRSMTDSELVQASMLIREESDAAWHRGDIECSEFLFERNMKIIREMNRRVERMTSRTKVTP